MQSGGLRHIIDASMIRGGGGFTHLVHVVPELARMAPRDHFRVLCGDRRVAEAVPRAAEWGADLYFSASEMAPLDAPCPMVAAFQNPNVFDLGRGQELPLRQKLRHRMLNVVARLTAKRCSRVMFVSEDSARARTSSP